jgi:hypothetical protein
LANLHLLGQPNTFSLQFGFTRHNTIACQSLCPDEVNSDSPSDIQSMFHHRWGELFALGGLGGGKSKRKPRENQQKITMQSQCDAVVRSKLARNLLLLVMYRPVVAEKSRVVAVPFIGKTGWGAFSAHIPEDGNAVVIFGP